MKPRVFAILLLLSFARFGCSSAKAWVVSIDVVGPIDAFVTIPPGWSTFANNTDRSSYPLDGVNRETVASLLPQLPIGSLLCKFDNHTQRLTYNRFTVRGWERPNESLHPGEGALVFNSAATNAIVEVFGWNTVGGKSASLVRGFNLVGNIGYGWDFFHLLDFRHLFDIRDGDVIFTWDKTHQHWQPHSYRASTGWDSYFYIAPTDSFFIFTWQPRVVGYGY
jgi:hypothetical protein